MKILLTGGAGFIGSHLADAFIANDYEVVIVDNLSSGRKENINSKAKFYEMDILDPKLEEVFKKEKPDFVSHHAAQINVRTSIENPQLDAKINIEGLLNVLENCKKYKIKKVFFPSSGGTVYGKTDILPSKEEDVLTPISPYAITKVAGERYLHYFWEIHELPFIIMRYGNVYGPRQDNRGEAGVVAIFTEKMLKNEQPIINGDGLQTRDYIYIEDIVKANLLALKSDKIGIYNIGTGKETNVNEIFDLIKRFTEFAGEKKYGPAIKGEVSRSCLNYEKAKNELKWVAKMSLIDGAQETVDWWGNNSSR